MPRAGFPAHGAHQHWLPTSVSPAGTSLAQALEQSSPEVRASPRGPGPWGSSHGVTRAGGRVSTATSEKDPMTAGSPLPGIPLSVPDCDQETLLLILLLHWAVTRRGHSPSASPGVLSKGCPHSHRLLSLLTASSLCTEHSPKSNLLIPDRHLQGDVTSPGQVWGHHSCSFRGEITFQDSTHPAS